MPQQSFACSYLLSWQLQLMSTSENGPMYLPSTSVEIASCLNILTAAMEVAYVPQSVPLSEKKIPWSQGKLEHYSKQFAVEI